MKAISGRPVKALQNGSTVKCADNSGAKIMQIISVKGYKGVWKTRPPAGVASWVNCKVLTGNEKVRHQVHKCIIIRQKKEYRRPDGTRISFEDNAVVVINDKAEPVGTLIKGPMAKEAAERFPVVAKIASMVI